MKGYSTGMVDANEDCDAAHDARPLSLELVGLSEVTVNTRVEQANNRCGKKEYAN